MTVAEARRVALVTGASRGIGRAIAVRLASEGTHVVVNHPHDRDAPDETLALIEAQGGTVVPFRADVSRVDEIAEMFAFVRGRVGSLDVLVNNAGVCPFASLFDVTEDLWDVIHSVNLKGAVFASQHRRRLECRTHPNRSRRTLLVPVDRWPGPAITQPLGVRTRLRLRELALGARTDAGGRRRWAL